MARQMFSFGLSGHKELMHAFEELPKSVGNAVLRTTITKAVRPVRDVAKSMVAQDEAHLANSIAISTRLSKRQKSIHGKSGDVVVYVGPSYPKGAHGHLLEFGTGARYHKATGKYVGVMAAKPFMRPAWDSNRSRVLETIRDDIWENIAKAARRLRKQAEGGKLSKSNTRFFGG